MKKIPSIFERDWDGDRSRVLDVINPQAQWVFDGEGVATRKYDGTCVFLSGELVYKRYERKVDKKTNKLKPAPEGFVSVGMDLQTGEVVGWVGVDKDNPPDQWIFEGLQNTIEANGGESLPDGTYELVGPKINANPDGYPIHVLVQHASALVYAGVERTYDGLKAFFEQESIEGLVFHHPDGRMAKIKGKDFGIKRQALVEVST